MEAFGGNELKMDALGGVTAYIGRNHCTNIVYDM